jgi:beta-lactamase regulating signal transducer with metallopeptidase domain
MTNLLSLPTIQTLGLTLLHFLWQGSIVGVVLFVTLCILRKPQTRYVVSCFALVALASLPVVTFVNLYEAPSNVETPVQKNVIPITHNPSDDVVTLEPAVTPPKQPTQYFVDKSRLTLYLPWLVLSWFVGALIFSCKLLFSFITLQRYKTKGVKLAAQTLQLKLLEFAKRLNVKQRITLLESKLVPVPVVLGWLRPIILLPTSAVTGLSPRQLEMLLAHELAHVLRRDYLVNVLQSVLESLLFYHPVVWWVSNQIRKEREYCCDDLAVSLTGNPQHYAQTLLTLAEMRVQLAPSASGGQLFTRVSRLLQPLETDMKPSYWFAGLSVLGVLTALALTVVNVSNAQEDTPQLWATVVGDVTFNEEYSEIVDMAPDAYIVVEERNGGEIKKVQIKVNTSEGADVEINGSAEINGSGDEITTFGNGESVKLSNARVDFGDGITLAADTVILKVEEDSVTATGYYYFVNGTKQDFNDDAETWYKQAFKDSIKAIYAKTPAEDREGFVSNENQTDQYKVYLLVDRYDMFKGHFFNAATSLWETQPSSQGLLDVYRNDLRQQQQLYSAGVLSDRGYAGYLDGVTADDNFPLELFPVALENATEISNKVLREHLVALIEKHQTEPKEPTPIYATTPAAEELSGSIKQTPSPDGKNRISGTVISNGDPVPHALVSLSIPLDASVDAGVIVANTRSNKNGEFSFIGFAIPSGEYILSIDGEDFFQSTDSTIEISSQELEVTLDVQKNFNTAKPASGETVSTTPTFSWESVPDAIRYLVMVHDTKTEEQVVYQMVDTESFTLELPLAPRSEYQWLIVAFNKNGKIINTAHAEVFKTE